MAESRGQKERKGIGARKKQKEVREDRQKEHDE